MKASPKAARRLRRSHTDAERRLWLLLRDRRRGGWKFRRQFPIDRFVVDFYCADAHLIIELDGGQHAARADADKSRTQILEAMGYLVLRFWNNDVMRNIDGVTQEIMAALDRYHALPLPTGERFEARGRGPSGPIPTFASRFGSSHANVGIKGPPANISPSGALDLTFASRVRGQAGSECQIRSTSRKASASDVPA